MDRRLEELIDRAKKGELDPGQAGEALSGTLGEIQNDIMRENAAEHEEAAMQVHRAARKVRRLG